MDVWFKAPQFRKWSHLNLPNDFKNLLTLQPKHLSISLDVRMLRFKQNDIFAVNSRYSRRLTSYHKENNYLWWLWTAQALFKAKIHMWLAFHDCLLTTNNLAKRSIDAMTIEKCRAHFSSLPFTLELCVREMSRLSLTSWPPTIVSLWDDWLSNIPQSEVDC